MKQSRGASARYLKDLPYRLDRFAEAFQRDIGNVTTAEVQEWLDNQKLSPQSYVNFQRVLHLLLKFAVAHAYSVDNSDDGAEKIEVRNGDVEIFKPAHSRDPARRELSFPMPKHLRRRDELIKVAPQLCPAAARNDTEQVVILLVIASLSAPARPRWMILWSELPLSRLTHVIRMALNCWTAANVRRLPADVPNPKPGRGRFANPRSTGGKERARARLVAVRDGVCGQEPAGAPGADRA